MNSVGVPVTSGRQAALDVALDAREHGGPDPVAVESRDIEADLRGIPPQVVVFEGVLAMEEQRVHRPEVVLERRRLRGRGHSVWVDGGQRGVPEGDADHLRGAPLDPLELAQRHPRVARHW